MIKVLFTLSFVFLSLGTLHATHLSCSISEARETFGRLLKYEKDHFPYYGEDEIELNEVCKDVGDSLASLKRIVLDCSNSPDCKDKCKEDVNKMASFLQSTGLLDFHLQMCDEDNEENTELRKTYLEHADCLEEYLDDFRKCHSETDLPSVLSLTNVTKKCCKLAFYRNCFTEIVEENCEHDALDFVTTSYKILMHASDLLCMNFACYNQTESILWSTPKPSVQSVKERIKSSATEEWAEPTEEQSTISNREESTILAVELPSHSATQFKAAGVIHKNIATRSAAAPIYAFLTFTAYYFLFLLL